MRSCGFGEKTVFRITDPRMVVLSDVATELGYREAHLVGCHISDKYKGPHVIGTPGGNQEMTCITKKGLLEALWQVNPRDAAKRDVVDAFRDWALDVLVDVLETGSRDAHAAPESNKILPRRLPDMSQMDALAQQSRLLADSIEQMAQMEQRINKIESDRRESMNELRSLPDPAVDAPEVDDYTRPFSPERWVLQKAFAVFLRER